MKKSTFIVIITFFLFTNSIYAQDLIDDLYYTTVNASEKTVSVSKYDYADYPETLTIPSTVTIRGEAHTVVGVKDKGFYGVAFKNVILPSTVKSIGTDAFRNCTGLSSISFSDVETIGQSAFNGCVSLTQLTLPSTVKNIGIWAFQNCEKLKSLTCEGTSTTGIPNCASSVVFLGTPDDMVVYVPSGELMTYRKDPVWGGLLNLTDGSSVPVSSVSLNYSTYTLEEGKSFILVATIKPENAANLKGSWTSNNESVATVDSKGNVKALKEGEAVITFTTEDGGNTAKCNVTVEKDDDTGNDVVSEDKVYISGDILYVKTSQENELIYVYTVSGMQIDKFVKDTELVVKNVSSYPKGFLIITNGKNLTKKVVNH